MKKIAVLITSFNRVEKTINCLKSLYNQTGLNNVVFQVFLTDDNSPDQTGKIIKSQFPEINVGYGDGNLFWAGGMRNSWQMAINQGTDFDYYLLLNDDTYLFDDCISRILNVDKELLDKYKKESIIIGTTIDPESGKFTYGGFKLTSKLRFKFKFVNNLEVEEHCDLGCANIMLVPGAIVKQIGILGEKFIHGIADFEYTLRAKKHGYLVFSAPGVYGYCKYDHGKSWKSQKTSFKERLAYLYSPKGLAYKEFIYFVKKYFPLDTPIIASKLWIKTIFPFLYDMFKTDGQIIKIDK